MKHMTKIMLATSIFIVGCSQKPVVTTKLKTVHNQFLEIKKDPDINTDAQIELLKAKNLYLQSKTAKSDEEADHLAFMLKKQIELAKQRVKKESLTKKISDLKEAHAKALLSQKESELIRLKQEKQNALAEAKLAEEAARLSEAKLLELQELNAQQTNRGLVLTLGDVLFETGKSKLLSGSVRAIEKLAEFLQDNENRQAIIEGHTDNVGSLTYNLDLSLRRSQSVKNALVDQNISLDRLFIKGYGEMYPVASNGDAGGRQRNRRVEIVILEEGANPEDMARENQD
jgi:outer membrane protein OmpA-like peptidoglycan-associated protein